MTRSRERLAPLALLVGAAVLGACMCTLVVASVVLHADGRMGVPIWQVVVAGGPMALLIAGLSAWVAARFARTLRLPRAAALRAVDRPPAPGGAPAPRLRSPAPARRRCRTGPAARWSSSPAPSTRCTCGCGWPTRWQSGI